MGYRWSTAAEGILAWLLICAGLYVALVAVVIPIQLFFGHLTGEYVLKHQPAKFAAIEARWKNEQPAKEVLIAIPDEANERNLFAITVPELGSFIASGNSKLPAERHISPRLPTECPA